MMKPDDHEVEYDPEKKPETTKQWLEEIEHNTGVIRAWVRFFGVVTIIGWVISIAIMCNVPRR